MKHLFAFIFVSYFAMFAACEGRGEQIELTPDHLSRNLQIHLKLRALMPLNYGPSLAAETLLNKYFSLGAMFNAVYFLLITNTQFEADIFAKAIYPYKIGTYDAKVYLMTPMGLTFFPGKSGPKLGFNFSALPGFEFYFNKHWGIFLEAGYNMTVYRTGPGHRLEISLGATYAIN